MARPGQRGFIRELAADLAHRRGARYVADPLAYAATVERRILAGRKPNPALAIFGANPGRSSGELFGFVDALPYRHLTKGRRVHHFDSPRVGMFALANGDTLLHETRGARTWGREGATVWLENPGGHHSKGTSMARHSASYYRSPAWMRHIRALAHKGRRAVTKYRRNDPDPGPRRRASSKGRRASVVHRIVYRRNPGPRSGIVGYLKEIPGAVLPSFAVLGGKVAARAIPTLLKSSALGVMGLLIQGVSAIGAGLVVNFVSPEYARYVLIGGLEAVEESYLRGVRLGAAQTPIPIIGPALGDATERYALAGYYFGPVGRPGQGAPARRPGVSSYLPRASGVSLAGRGMESAANVQAARPMMVFG